MSTRPDPFAQLMRSGRAATIILIALLALFYVAAWIAKSPAIFDNLAFNGDWSRPWSAVLYPLATRYSGSSFLCFLGLLLWLYWVGGDLERDLGPWRLIAMFGLCSLIGSIAVTIPILIFKSPTILFGDVIPVGALTVAWGARNPNTSIRLWAVIPITGKWIAIIDAGFVLFWVGELSVLAGVFALVPLGLAALFAMNQLPGIPYSGATRRESKVAKATERRKQSYYDDVYRRSKEREEQEKLRKLLESSLDDDK